MHDAEAYMYDGECEAKAEELGKPGLVNITLQEVKPTTNDICCSFNK